MDCIGPLVPTGKICKVLRERCEGGNGFNTEPPQALMPAYYSAA
jgi:hypothetical protein